MPTLTNSKPDAAQGIFIRRPPIPATNPGGFQVI
jgi:hypothetical protein